MDLVDLRIDARGDQQSFIPALGGSALASLSYADRKQLHNACAR
jgi:hypothetical protein